MKLLLLFVLVSCASRYENFDKVEPGMTKAELRSEMTMVQGMMNFPPYEFRTYNAGLVVLQDDKVVQTFETPDDEEEFTVTYSTKLAKQRVPERFYIPEAEGQGLLHQRLKLLLRLRGFTVVERSTPSVSTMTMNYLTSPHRLELTAQTPDGKNSWSIEVECDSLSNAGLVMPALLAVVPEAINVRTKEDVEVELRPSNVSLQILRNSAAIYQILDSDKTLGD